MEFVYDSVEKILWEMEKNAGDQHFVLFPECFQKRFNYTVWDVKPLPHHPDF